VTQPEHWRFSSANHWLSGGDPTSNVVLSPMFFGRACGRVRRPRAERWRSCRQSPNYLEVTPMATCSANRIVVCLLVFYQHFGDNGRR